MTLPEDNKLININVDVDLPYRWAAGKYFSKLLRSIRDEKKFIGNRCPSCGKVYVPPRVVCGPCFVQPDEWVELGSEGTLEGYSVVNYPFIDPETGQNRPVPYTYGYIKLDGCDTNVSHFVNEHDPNKLSPGMRVAAVFKEDGKRVGNMMDILYFEVIKK